MAHTESKPSAKANCRQSARVLIVDDHELLRNGLAELLDNQPDMQVCGQASGEREAWELAGDVAPESGDHRHLAGRGQWNRTDQAIGAPRSSTADRRVVVVRRDAVRRARVARWCTGLHQQANASPPDRRGHSPGVGRKPVSQRADDQAIGAASHGFARSRHFRRWTRSRTASWKSSRTSAAAIRPARLPKNSTSAPAPWTLIANASRPNSACNPAPN